MNKVILVGRICKDVDTRQGNGTSVSRYTLAVDRKFKKDGEPSAEFISCVAFGRSSEFADKYLRKGMKIAIVGRIQTGSYTDKNGNKVYTTDIVVEEHEFCESKGEQVPPPTPLGNGFVAVPEGYDEELPFN